MKLAENRVCNLELYPGEGGVASPLILDYLPQRNELAGCGTFGEFDRSCYSLRPGSPEAWQPLSSLAQDHCNLLISTRSHVSPELGWFVFGHEGTVCQSDTNFGDLFIADLLTNTDNKWTVSPVASPYPNGYPASSCSVLLNPTTVMVTGGYDNDMTTLDMCFLLDLNTMTWTKVAPMLKPRQDHTCVVTVDGEVLIAAGQDGSVHVYNPATNSWREEQDLPDQVTTFYESALLLLNGMPSFVEVDTDKIWQRQEDGSWEMMDVSLGAEFDGFFDHLVPVPADLYQCP